MSIVKTSLSAPAGEPLRYEQIVSEETLHGVGALPSDALGNATPKTLNQPNSDMAANLAGTVQVHAASLFQGQMLASANPVVSADNERGTSGLTAGNAGIASATVNGLGGHGTANIIDNADSNTFASTGGSDTHTATSTTTTIQTIIFNDPPAPPVPPTPPAGNGLYISAQATPEVIQLLQGDGSVGSVLHNVTGLVDSLPGALTILPDNPLTHSGGLIDTALHTVTGAVNTLVDNLAANSPLVNDLLHDNNGPLAQVVQTANHVVEGTLSAVDTALPQLAPVLSGDVPIISLGLTDNGATATVANMVTVHLPTVDDLGSALSGGNPVVLTLGGEGVVGSLIDANLVSPLLPTPLVDVTLGTAPGASTPAGVLDVNLLQNGLQAGAGNNPVVELSLGGQSTDGHDGGLLDVGLLDGATSSLGSIATIDIGGNHPLDVTVLGQPITAPPDAAITPVLDTLIHDVVDSNVTPLADWATNTTAPLIGQLAQDVVNGNVLPVVGSVADTIGNLLDSTTQQTSSGMDNTPVHNVADSVANTVSTGLTTITSTVTSLPVAPVIASIPGVMHGLFHH